MFLFRIFKISVVCMALAACTNFEYHETENVPVTRLSPSQEAQLEEAQLLDIGVVLFDPGEVDLDTNETDFSNVRESEAVWITQQLKDTLDRSNAWGLVRALPHDKLSLDVTVYGKIIKSNGEQIKLHITAKDNRGVEWLNKEYHQQVSQYAYNPEVNIPGDPFQTTYNQIANDLFDYQQNVAGKDKLQIRSLTKVLFARDFVPDAFTDFVTESEGGQLALQRIPAADDPMMQRVDRIRSRNDLFIDVIQEFYRSFNAKMELPYTEWRKLAYKETIYARQLKEQASKERLAGIVAIAGGVAAATQGDRRSTRIAGHGAIIGGAGLFRQSFAKKDRALSHSAALRELSESLETELEPSIVALQDRSVTLSGTVDDQYQEWRRILAEMFRLEEGIDEADNSSDDKSLSQADFDAQANGLDKEQ